VRNGHAGVGFARAGNVNGIGPWEIIVGAGASSSHVKVFDATGTATLASFLAFTGPIPGGVGVAAADRNGDGGADVIAAAGAGTGPHVKTVSSLSLLRGEGLGLLDSFFAFDAMFSGGVFVG
jgi:hypothetical protein